MTIMNNINPAFIFFGIGILAAMTPGILRRIILLGLPVFALLAAINLEVGTKASYSFLPDYTSYYMNVDKLSWIFVFIFCIMGVIGSIYASHNESKIEALCSMGYVGSAIGTVLAEDWMTFLFFWELMAASSLFLIWNEKREASRGAGLRYLAVHFLGGNLILFGVLQKLAANEVLITCLTSGPKDLAFWMILTGVCINVAAIPVHAWLVDSYPSATITGGVFMSSYTTKVAVYALLRIFAGLDVLMAVGAVMAIYGALYAIMENDMLKLLSYHIISQVGFMVAGVGIGTEMAMNGAVAHAFSDILFKSLLFMCCGAIIYATGIRRINQLGGIAKKYPAVFVCFLIGAMSISGIPLFNGFISKTITIAAAGAAHYEVLEVLLEVASIGTLMSILFKMVYFIFLAPAKEEIKVRSTIPKNMYVGMGLGAFLCTFYGCFPDYLYQYLPYPLEYHPFSIGHIALFMQLAFMAVIPFIMYLPKMEPHSLLSLDTDWFYRRPFATAVRYCSYLGSATCNALGEAWGMLTGRVMELSSNPMQFLDAKGFRQKRHYNPENYRTAIADPIMIMLTVLLMSICYFMVRV